MLSSTPKIKDFYCFKTNNLDYDDRFIIMLTIVLKEATHFAHAAQFLTNSSTEIEEEKKSSADCYKTNWLAFKHIEVPIIYERVELNKEMIKEFSNYTSLLDFTFKEKEYYHPLFFKDKELIFCSVSTDGLMFVKKNLVS